LPGFGAEANPFLGKDRPVPVRPPSQGFSSGLIEIQLQIREKIADLMSTLNTNPSFSTLAVFFSAAFIYGLIHAAGPGHRKSIIFTLFISRKSEVFEPVAAGFYTAALHAGTSVILILLFRFLINKSSSFINADIASSYVEVLSLVFLGIFALILMIIKVSEIAFHKNSDLPKNRSISGQGSFFLLLTVSSLFPCPGAMMLLILSLSLDILPLGIIGVIFMSAGMGIVISAVGLLARGGRTNIFNRLENHKKTAAAAGNIFEILSYLLLFVFSAWMTWPFISRLLF